MTTPSARSTLRTPIGSTRPVAVVAALLLGLFALAGCGAGGPNDAYAALRSAYMSGDADGIEDALSTSFKEKVGERGNLSDYLKTALPSISDLEPLVAKLLPDAKKTAEESIPKLEEELKSAQEAANNADAGRKQAAEKRLAAVRRNLEWAKESLGMLDGDFFYQLAAARQHAKSTGDKSFDGMNVDRALALCVPDSEIGKMLENTPQGAHGYMVEITLADGTVVRMTAVEENGTWKMAWPFG